MAKQTTDMRREMLNIEIEIDEKQIVQIEEINRVYKDGVADLKTVRKNALTELKTMKKALMNEAKVNQDEVV